jgi:heptosyltransferase-3
MRADNEKITKYHKKAHDDAVCVPVSAQPVRRILVIKLRHFGDVLLVTPLLRTLKQNYPGVLVDVLVYRETEVMLRANADIHCCYTVDRQLKYQGIRTQLRGEKVLWDSLKAGKYDLIINLSDQWRAAAYCLLLSPACSIGFDWPKRNNLLWRRCHSVLVDTRRQHETHTVLNHLSILRPLNLPCTDTTVTMSWTQQDAARAGLLLQENRLDNYVLIHPGARWAFKTWSPQAFAEVINNLGKNGWPVLLTGGTSQEERQMAAAILAAVTDPEHVVNLTGRLDMPVLAVLISRARLFIGVDSAPMHMAAALQISSVVLFGPSNIKQWHPWQAPYTLLWAGDYRPLPLPDEVNTDTAERYLNAIPACDVIAAIKKWLTC